MMECAAPCSFLNSQPRAAVLLHRLPERRDRPLCHLIARQQTWQVLNLALHSGLRFQPVDRRWFRLVQPRRARVCANRQPNRNQHHVAHRACHPFDRYPLCTANRQRCCMPSGQPRMQAHWTRIYAEAIAGAVIALRRHPSRGTRNSCVRAFLQGTERDRPLPGGLPETDGKIHRMSRDRC